MRISPETYSAWSNNSSTRALSSSGGLYSEIAKHLLEQGYAVVGARYKEDCKVLCVGSEMAGGVLQTGANVFQGGVDEILEGNG